MNNNLAALLTTLLVSSCGMQDAPVCDHAGTFRIDNVSIVDGSGDAARDGSVRVSEGVIAAVGALHACEGETVVDGEGFVLAPGFIDSHSHADSDLFEHPDATPVISQGITTIVAGQDGFSPYPLAEFFAQFEASPATVNLASYAGHNSLREAVMGEDSRRVATPDETDHMMALLAGELAEGALGLGAGLEYEPGIHSDTTEVLALARVAASSGGRYIAHVRSEDRWFEDAIDETILIGRETGMPVQISHIKLAMKRNWGTARDLIEKLNAARAEGIDVTADIYPYEYWQSTMMVLLPDRDPGNLEVIAEVLDQIAPPDGMWMTSFAPKPGYVGKTLTEIADILEVDAVTAFSQLATEALEWEARTGESAESIIGTSMIAGDISTLMQWPHTNICTDGGIVDRHPRAIGAFPRVLGRYSREQALFSLEEAVHKMTGLTASHLGFEDRGLIKEGMIADLVLFDPDTVIDHATPLQPDLISTGIHTVWVGGIVVFEDGTATDARPGRLIRRYSTGDASKSSK